MLPSPKLSLICVGLAAATSLLLTCCAAGCGGKTPSARSSQLTPTSPSAPPPPSTTKDVAAPAVEPETQRALALASILYQGICVRQLSRSDVQEDLKLTTGQTGQLAPLLAKLKLAQDELRKCRVDELPNVIGRYEPQAAEMDERLRMVLSEPQRSRLQKRVLNNAQGPLVLLAPPVRQVLQLDAGQTAEIAAIVWDDFEHLKSASLLQLPALRQRTRESRQRAESKLTAAQREQLQKLLAEQQ